jgi:hypothetical protein
LQSELDKLSPSEFQERENEQEEFKVNNNDQREDISNWDSNDKYLEEKIDEALANVDDHERDILIAESPDGIYILREEIEYLEKMASDIINTAKNRKTLNDED